MALTPHSVAIGHGIKGAMFGAARGVAHFMGFAPPLATWDEILGSAPLPDERLRPQAPMQRVNMRGRAADMSLDNTFEITATTHPEFYAAWTTLCHRAGYRHPLQLLVAQTNDINATAFSDGTMVVTTGLLKLLNLRETVSVLAHELGHERHDHDTPARLSHALFGLGGIMAGHAVGQHGGLDSFYHRVVAKGGASGRWLARHLAEAPAEYSPRQASLLGSLVYMAVGWMFGQTLANQVSTKPAELQADLEAVAIGGDPEGLASALTKLDRAVHGSALNTWLAYLTSGYPTIAERLDSIRRAAAETPAHPIAIAMEPPPGPHIHAVDHAERLVANPEAARING